MVTPEGSPRRFNELGVTPPTQGALAALYAVQDSGPTDQGMVQKTNSLFLTVSRHDQPAIDSPSGPTKRTNGPQYHMATSSCSAIRTRAGCKIRRVHTRRSVSTDARLQARARFRTQHDRNISLSWETTVQKHTSAGTCAAIVSQAQRFRGHNYSPI